MSPRLSIVVPVLNEATTIETTLRSLDPVRNQGVEVIVVDGGSSDTTTQLCIGLADYVLVSLRGRAQQMNVGAAKASGRILLFLHADTRLPEGFLSAVEHSLASATWGRFDVKICGRSPMLTVVATLMNWRSRLSGIATGDQAIFVRREAFVHVGGFPDQPLMEDIEISRRLLRFGKPACLSLRVFTSGRRWERFGIWKTIFLMWRLRFLYWLGRPVHKLARHYQ